MKKKTIKYEDFFTETTQQIQVIEDIYKILEILGFETIEDTQKISIRTDKGIHSISCLSFGSKNEYQLKNLKIPILYNLDYLIKVIKEQVKEIMDKKDEQ